MLSLPTFAAFSAEFEKIAKTRYQKMMEAGQLDSGSMNRLNQAAQLPTEGYAPMFSQGALTRPVSNEFGQGLAAGRINPSEAAGITERLPSVDTQLAGVTNGPEALERYESQLGAANQRSALRQRLRQTPAEAPLQERLTEQKFFGKNAPRPAVTPVNLPQEKPVAGAVAPPTPAASAAAPTTAPAATTTAPAAAAKKTRVKAPAAATQTAAKAEGQAAKKGLSALNGQTLRKALPYAGGALALGGGAALAHHLWKSHHQQQPQPMGQLQQPPMSY